MFIEKYSVDKMAPADYNPRKIKEGAFDKLKESLLTFGVVKPVIINKNGILVAGHQRTKAMKAVGIEECPVFFLKKQISLPDEIKFNLMHNSIETETAKVKIDNIKELNFGFTFVNAEHINIIEKGNGNFTSEIAKLFSKYGDFSGVICDEKGAIIHNADYAFICKSFNAKCLVYKMKDEKVKEFVKFMKIDYGNYNYDSLNIKPYVQTHCQMSRDENNNRSTTYLKHVIPNIDKKQRGIDFGAGKRFYQKSLKKKGYNIHAYEPFYKKEGTEKLDLREVVTMIKDITNDVEQNGLYDYVVLDSVLNSVSSDEYEDAILKSCNSLLSPDGTFFTGTRGIKPTKVSKGSIKSHDRRNIEFVDENNYSATFRKGVWTLQKFNSVDGLKKLLSKYFDEVVIHGTDSSSQIWGVCKKPKQFKKDTYKDALTKEFNIEYPNNYRHNRHERIIDAILKYHD